MDCGGFDSSFQLKVEPVKSVEVSSYNDASKQKGTHLKWRDTWQLRANIGL